MTTHILRFVFRLSLCSPLFFLAAERLYAEDDFDAGVLEAAKKATHFLTSISTEGGYLWRYSADLTLREGEGIVEHATIWVQPPGTPTVGDAFLQLYEATGDQQFLDAARAAGEALRRGQMRSGGWQAMVEFESDRRRKWAYRVAPPRDDEKDQSSLDDDKTQSAIRFVMRLDRALGFADAAVHEMAEFAMTSLIERGQFRNGGFPQVWQRHKGAEPRSGAARFPNQWSRTYPGHREYWSQPTLNDNLAPDVMRTLLLAEEIYGDPDYRKAATKLADFLLMAQMPDPQPAWAQQYNRQMQPIWARKFEPPAVTGGESQGVIATLMDFYEVTGQRKYLEPIPRALDYLERSQLPDGKLARFYELETNRPLFFTKTYELTYDDSDSPTHYSFRVSSRVSQLRARYEKLIASRWNPRSLSSSAPRVSRERVSQILGELDDRGAWLSEQGLRYHKRAGSVIEMARATSNLVSLANWLASSGPRASPLWDARVPLPKAEELAHVEGARFHVIKPHVPEQDGYDWLHGVAIAWHNGRLYATFGHNTGAENTASEVAQSCYSEDQGATWSPLRLIDHGPEEDLAISHGVLLSARGRLWAFHGAFFGHLRDVHTRAYRLDEDSGHWDKIGTVMGDGFWPMDAPRRMQDGNWIVAGIRIQDGNGGANDPAAVAISHGDDLTRWDIVVIPKSPANDMWGESTVLFDGAKLLNIARFRRPTALAAHSDNFGRTWTMTRRSNLPMVASKPFAGRLSTGARYLVCTTTADSGNRRSPLTIALSDPGRPSFHRVLSIRGADDQVPGESHPRASLAYPYAVEHEGSLYVAYSNDGGRGKNRNSAELAVLPLTSLQRE